MGGSVLAFEWLRNAAHGLPIVGKDSGACRPALQWKPFVKVNRQGPLPSPLAGEGGRAPAAKPPSKARSDEGCWRKRGVSELAPVKTHFASCEVTLRPTPLIRLRQRRLCRRAQAPSPTRGEGKARSVLVRLRIERVQDHAGVVARIQHAIGVTPLAGQPRFDEGIGDAPCPQPLQLRRGRRQRQLFRQNPG